jgi:hypothetical protein
VTDQQDRRKASLATDETPYEREREGEERRRHEIAERLMDDPPPEPSEE